MRPGESTQIQLEAASLFDYTQLNIPVEIICGKLGGPTLFISAAIHGDEINGIEIIKRIFQKTALLKKLHGTLILIPVVNIFGFNNKSRYLPDRRDLNRCFPGNAKGSMGARIAHLFMKQIVSQCTHGIDLHTGGLHRTNLPQIRACLDDPQTAALAKGFGVPVVIDSSLRDGSLREAARKRKVATLLFEGGEALRFNESVIRAGVRGCLSVMRHISMLPPGKSSSKPAGKTFVAKGSYWVRAAHSGSFIASKRIGDEVKENERLAVISDPFGRGEVEIRADDGGIIIGMSTIPLVNKGDAMIHIASFTNTKHVKEAIDLND